MKNKNHIFRIAARVTLVFLVIIFALPKQICATGKNDKKVKWEKSKTGLGSLMALSKDRGVMEADYAKETKSYNALKEALEKGDLERGLTNEEIIKKFGKAVVVLPEGSEGMERWVYKASEFSYFKGAKVYLFFNSQGELESWELAE